MPENMEFADWLMSEFVKWRAEQSGHPNLRAFSKVINVPYRQMSAWLNGKGAPSEAQLIEFTKLLSSPPPNTAPLAPEKVEMSMIDTIVANWGRLSHEEQQQVFNLFSSFHSK